MFIQLAAPRTQVLEIQVNPSATTPERLDGLFQPDSAGRIQTTRALASVNPGAEQKSPWLPVFSETRRSPPMWLVVASFNTRSWKPRIKLSQRGAEPVSELPPSVTFRWGSIYLLSAFPPGAWFWQIFTSIHSRLGWPPAVGVDL